MQILSGSLDRFNGRVRRVDLPKFEEGRGRLTEFDYAVLPFAPRRAFVVDNVPKGTVRGGHGHRTCEQVLVCLHGRLTIGLRWGDLRAEIILDDPSVALYLGAGVWSRQSYDTDDTRLLAFASLPFDPQSYLPSPPPE